MRKAGGIATILLLVLVLSTSLSFAAGLSLVSSFPEEGNDNLQPANVAVKLVFSENMTGDAAIAANDGRFTITDQDGKAIKFDPLYNAEKYPNEIWLQITETLVDNTEYTVKIDGGLESTAGNTLDGPITLHFSTRDTAADNNGYMILMVVMVVGMVFFTAWDTRRQVKKQQDAKDDGKVNPYKEARKTGKSVEEIVAKTEKEKSKAERRQARESGNDSGAKEDDGAKDSDGYKVKAKRSIASAGVATPAVVLRKQAERAEKEAAAAKKAGKEPDRQRSRGSKQQQRKKK